MLHTARGGWRIWILTWIESCIWGVSHATSESDSNLQCCILTMRITIKKNWDKKKITVAVKLNYLLDFSNCWKHHSQIPNTMLLPYSIYLQKMKKMVTIQLGWIILFPYWCLLLFIYNSKHQSDHFSPPRAITAINNHRK